MRYLCSRSTNFDEVWYDDADGGKFHNHYRTGAASRFSMQMVILRKVSTINKSTVSYVYSQLGTVFLRQLNSMWFLVIPDIDNIRLIIKR